MPDSSVSDISIPLHDRVHYAGLSGAIALFERLSLDRGTALAAALARPLVPVVRSRALANLRLAMPDLAERERRRIVTDMADHLTRMSVEYLHLAELRDDPDRIALHGVEHLDAARAAGRGAILVTGHFGNWEAIRIACARLDWTPAILYRRFNNPLVDGEARRRMGIFDAPLLHKGRRGTLGFLRHVRGGGAALILADQRFGGAPPIPFFGQPARTALAPAEIAAAHGVALLPVRAVRRGRSSVFDVTIDPPLIPGKGDGAAFETMAEFNRRLESWIREVPEQYFWLHNRWRLNTR